MLQGQPRKQNNSDKGQGRQGDDGKEHWDHSALDAKTGHKNQGPLDHLDRGDFDRDLRPKERQGENSGVGTAHAPDSLLRAYDDKELVNSLQGFSSDELKLILILPRGAKLEQGARYVDLNDPDRLEIVASGENPVTPHLEAQENQRLVPKSQLDYELWDKLTGKGDRVNAS